MAAAPELVAGPSAGRWDLWRRFAQLAWVLLLVAAVALVATRSVSALAVAVPAAVLVIAAAIASWIFARRATATMKLERAAGYSTLIDAEGYELRDFRTLAVLRPKDVSPSADSRRSLALGIFGVKPGTVLAKRLDEQAAERPVEQAAEQPEPTKKPEPADGPESPDRPPDLP